MNLIIKQIASTLDGLLEIINRELAAMKALGGVEAQIVFIQAQQILQSSKRNSSFTGCVEVLNDINKCAKLFELQAAIDPAGIEYWYQHAYACRTNAEQLATSLLHSAGSVPKFEHSLAHLRVSCAYLAKSLGRDEDAMRYTQGALRLAAPEQDIELAKSVMQSH